jgi:hypothetical protein
MKLLLRGMIGRKSYLVFNDPLRGWEMGNDASILRMEEEEEEEITLRFNRQRPIRNLVEQS